MKWVSKWTQKWKMLKCEKISKLYLLKKKPKRVKVCMEFLCRNIRESVNHTKKEKIWNLTKFSCEHYHQNLWLQGFKKFAHTNLLSFVLLFCVRVKHQNCYKFVKKLEKFMKFFCCQFEFLSFVYYAKCSHACDFTIIDHQVIFYLKFSQVLL